jgi:glycosyltransferase involved in cell wall biosynthesis
MKVLLVTHKPPFPKIDGGCLATAQLILGLENSNVEYRIALIETPKHPFQMQSFPQAIREKIAVHHFINTTNFWPTIRNGIYSTRSVFFQRFYDKNFAIQLNQLCSDFQPDIIHFESLFAAVYLDGLKKISPAKMILRSHNIEHQLWEDRLKNLSALKRMVLKTQVKRLKIEEISVFQKVDGIACIAVNELHFLQNQAVNASVVLIPTGFQLGSSMSHFGNDFFHLAAMDWQPNCNALDWFLKSVWKNSPSSKNNLLHLAGKGLDLERYREFSGVKNHGMVLDSEAFMCGHGIMLVPLFEGSGLRIKIIEAGALGVPIIASAKAVEGIGLVPNEHFLEANNAQAFENAMQLLANDVSLRQSIGAAIRSFMQKNYDQDIFNNQLIEFYQNI